MFVSVSTHPRTNMLPLHNTHTLSQYMRHTTPIRKASGRIGIKLSSFFWIIYCTAIIFHSNSDVKPRKIEILWALKMETIMRTVSGCSVFMNTCKHMYIGIYTVNIFHKQTCPVLPRWSFLRQNVTICGTDLKDHFPT